MNALANITVWHVDGRRNRPDGGTSELLAAAFGADEAAARRNFDKVQAKYADLRGEPHSPWQPHELTFTQVQQK